jgi:hypothetical protein
MILESKPVDPNRSHYKKLIFRHIMQVPKSFVTFQMHPLGLEGKSSTSAGMPRSSKPAAMARSDSQDRLLGCALAPVRPPPSRLLVPFAVKRAPRSPPVASRKADITSSQRRADLMPESHNPNESALRAG